MINKLKYLLKKRKEKKRKGFTLVELLAVVVILAVIMVITIPTVLGNMKEARQQAFNTVGETMRKYLVDNYQNCKLGNKDIAKYDEDLFNSDDCSLKYNAIIDEKKFSELLIENSGYTTSDIEKVDVTDDGRGNYGIYMYPKSDGEFYDVKKQLTNSIPNKPDLSTGLVPIKYNGTNWVVTTSTDPEWFDYSNQKWANAASLKEGTSKEPGTILIVPDGTSLESNIYAMFVWIPRFSYTIGCTSSTSCYGYKIDGASKLAQATPGAIDIKFISAKLKEDTGVNSTPNPVYPNYTYASQEEREPSNWYTHPAFTFGAKELSGIWVGKFETSVDTTSKCYKAMATDDCIASNETVTPIILPNVLSLRYQTVSNQIDIDKKFSIKGNIYGINSEKSNGHIMINSEWAAVAYLSQSIYGKYGNSDYSGANREIYKNNYSGYYTGISAGIPNTGSSSSIICRYNEEGDDRSEGTGLCGPGASTTGNIYGIYDMSGGAYDRVISSGSDIGQAINETKNWYSDKYNELGDYLIRGGIHNTSQPGLFYFTKFDDSKNISITYRTVLIKNN